jgi:hypothetical protein
MYFDEPDEDLTESEQVAAAQKRVYFYGNTVVLDSIVYYTQTVRFTGWLNLFGL